MASRPITTLPEGVLTNKDSSKTTFSIVVSNLCIACGHPWTDGAVLVMAAPYHGILHWGCRQWMPIDGEWPHPQPVAIYLENLSSRGTDG